MSDGLYLGCLLVASLCAVLLSFIWHLDWWAQVHWCDDGPAGPSSQAMPPECACRTACQIAASPLV